MIKILVVLILISSMVHAARITVGPGDEDYPQIQMAIDNSTKGDIIEVHSGTYQEKLRVRKSVTLMGVDTGDGLPVINANKTGSAITLKANGSTIEGLNLTGSGKCGCGDAGIRVMSSDNTIQNNILYNNKYGIYVPSGYINNTFISNNFIGNKIAAYDQANNSWNCSIEGRGNYYSDYDETDEGCNDTDDDGFCDLPKKIEGGSGIDWYPSTMPCL